MRKILLIAWNGLLRTARDRKGLLLMLVMPMVLIGILGAALEGMMGDDGINPFPVVVVNADEPTQAPLPPGVPVEAAPEQPALDFGRTLVEDVLESEQVQQIMRLTYLDHLEEAREQVLAGSVSAAIYVPPTFTADVLAGKEARVQIFSDPGRPSDAEIVVQVVNSYTEALSRNTLVNQVLSPEQAQALLEDIVPAPDIQEVPSGTREVSALQYYAGAMAIMFMLMTALGRARDMLQEQEDGTLNRLLITPTGSRKILAGQILSTMGVLLAQFLILLLGTHFLYGVYWGPWIPVLAMGTGFAFASTGVGAAAAALFRDPRAADASVGVLGNIFGALSGTMFPLYFFPPGLKLVAHAIPNYWALQGFLDLMAGTELSALWPPLMVLGATGILTGSLGAWRLSTR